MWVKCFDLSCSYEIKERTPYLGETRITKGEPTWKSLDRAAVEVLV
jgi:hypothetical protein